MKKQRCPQDVLSESIRVAMLESFCEKDHRLSVSQIQMMKTERGYDYEMLEEIQTDFPDAEIYFVTGSDKLYVLPRWHRVDELIEKFRILVAKRGEDDLEKIKEIRPYLAAHWDRFTVFPVPEEISQISSSAFREKLHAMDESAKEYVTPEVWEIMNKNGKLPWNSITDFHQEEYRFLSNFYRRKAALHRIRPRQEQGRRQTGAPPARLGRSEGGHHGGNRPRQIHPASRAGRDAAGHRRKGAGGGQHLGRHLLGR